MKPHPLPLSAVVALALAVLAPGVARADERTRAAQEALTTRGFYFGTPDGQPGAATSEAVRRFQIRQGLPVSGELDEATASALDLRLAPAATPKPRAATTETDRDFLRQNGLAPAAPPTPAPPWMTTTTSRPPAPKPSPQVVAPSRPTPAPVPRGPNVFTNVPSPAPAPAAAITRTEAARFLRRFLTAGAGDDAAAELSYYAPEVDYFNQGRQSRRFIARDQNAYRRRWPFRRYELLDEPEVARDGATVRYRLGYQVQSPARATSGETRGEVTLRRMPGDPPGGLEITAIRERARSD